jgi:peptidyl-prolyl cis-trans isomerase SurA
MRYRFNSISKLLVCAFLISSNIWAATEVKKSDPPTTQKTTEKTEPAPSTPKGKRHTLDRLEASVNSSIILQSDIRKFREIMKLRAQLDPLFAGTSVAAKGPQASDADIVEFLINERLITQQYPKTDAEVEQEINSIQANNRLSRTDLKEALSREGFKFTDYFELIRDSSSKRDLIDRDIRTKVSISDDDVKNYFYNNMAKGTNIARSYHIQIISVSLQSYKNAASANKVAQDALKSINSGESFEEVAKRVSDDPSASSGGDLGTFTEDQISPLIRAEVKKLQIGKVSGIFGGPTSSGTGKSAKSSGRYYILKLVDIKSSESDRYDKVKEEIRNQLAASEYQHQISLWLERQRQSAFIHRAGEPSVKSLPIVR